MKQRTVTTIHTEDTPVRIDPQSVTVSVVIAESNRIADEPLVRAAMKEDSANQLAGSIQNLLNPTLWRLVAHRSLRSRLTIIGNPFSLDVALIVLNQLGVPDDTSVFVRGGSVSLDGGKTTHKVWTLIVFKEAEPRILISTKEAVSGRGGATDDVHFIIFGPSDGIHALHKMITAKDPGAKCLVGRTVSEIERQSSLARTTTLKPLALVFEHYIPGRRGDPSTEDDFKRWKTTLMDSVPRVFGPDGPAGKLQWYFSAKESTATIVWKWDEMQIATCFEIATVIESGFRALSEGK